MKIFVTGGTGFIGSHLLNALAKTHHHVVALKRINSKPSIELVRQPDWMIKEMDLLDEQDFAGVDVLIHLAGVGMTPRQADWADLIYWNVSVPIKMLELAKRTGVKRCVLAGSFAEYGLSADHYEFIPVNAPLLPVNPYAASKAALSVTSQAFAIQNQIELCYLRIFSAYGEGQYYENFWPALKEAAFSGKDFAMTFGEQIRDYVPVEKVVKDFLFAAERNDVIPGNPLVSNVGSGHPISVLEFAKYWWSFWQAQGQLKPGEIPYRKKEPMRFVPFIERS